LGRKPDRVAPPPSRPVCAITASRRPLDEELGLTLDAEPVVGLLDDYPTRWPRRRALVRAACCS